MKLLGTAFVYLGLYIVYTMIVQDRYDLTVTKFVLAMVFSLPILWLGQHFLSKHQGEIQLIIDGQAKDIVDHTKGFEFFLYLRPFSSTNAFKVTTDDGNFFSLRFWESDGFDDIERLISDALSSTAPLVGLGKPGEHRGAGRYLTSDSDWREKVLLLIQDSRLIVAVPSSNPGTLWELEQLMIHGSLSKTVFVMPPSTNGFYSSRMNVAGEWSQAVEAVKAFGMLLPEHLTDGAIFTLRPDGTSISPISLPPPMVDAWYKTLQRAIGTLS